MSKSLFIYFWWNRNHFSIESFFSEIKTPITKKSGSYISSKCFSHHKNKSFTSSFVEKCIVKDTNFFLHFDTFIESMLWRVYRKSKIFKKYIILLPHYLMGTKLFCISNKWYISSILYKMYSSYKTSSIINLWKLFNLISWKKSVIIYIYLKLRYGY